MEVVQQKKGHPKGLYLLFFTEMWERFSYYGMRAILMYYLTKTYLQGGLGINSAEASIIYGNFTGLVYFTPLIGGWLADKYLGQRLAVTIGGITMMLGQFALFLMNNMTGLYIGLLLLIIGNGFFKPNISILVGNLYKDGDERRDSAFSIFYMGINLGALIAPLVIGVLTDDIFAAKDNSGEIISYGYRYGFLASSIGMLLGQVVFNLLAPKYLGEIGTKPVVKSKKQEEGQQVDTLNKEEKNKISVIFILFLFAVFFWAGFEQAGSSIALYTDKFIDREVILPCIGKKTIPPAWFQSVNPFFVVTLAPLFAMFWSSPLGRKISTPIKMGVGMVILGIGFWFMLGAVSERGGDIKDTAVKASLFWLVMTYFVHTVGELCISPVGLSVVTKLSPPKLASVLMAVWMLSSSVANFLGGFIAAYVEKMGAGQIFTYISGFVIVCGVLLILLNRPISKMMHGVK